MADRPVGAFRVIGWKQRPLSPTESAKGEESRGSWTPIRFQKLEVREMERVVLTRAMVGFAHMQVCAASDATDEEILAVCNARNQSGTDRGWTTVCRGDDEFWGPTRPVQCSDDPARTHFLVSC